MKPAKIFFKFSAVLFVILIFTTIIDCRGKRRKGRKKHKKEQQSLNETIEQKRPIEQSNRSLKYIQNNRNGRNDMPWQTTLFEAATTQTTHRSTMSRLIQATSTQATSSLTRNDKCGEIPGITQNKTGKPAWDNCIDFAKVIFPCEPNYFMVVPNYRRKDVCSHSSVPLIAGGKPAADNEFPHMALLGYGDTYEEATWECGGTLISERWVMTAAHCLYNSKNIKVKYIRLGSPKVDDILDRTYLYTIAMSVEHPDYTSTASYNDIALLQTFKSIIFGERVIPGCLHMGNPVADDKFLATGWGVTESQGKRSQSLLKVTLEKVTIDECSKIYSNRADKEPQGVRDEIQICGGRTGKDTCSGDSGGPLQIYNSGVNCTYLIIGVITHGKICGLTAGLYTRVAPFVPWIESEVWP